MLTTLRIKNLALVADLTLELPAGLNVITGETGAGKSILIGALSLVLGERADRTLLRAGADSCVVEAVFDVRSLRAPLAAFLEENGLEPCEGGQLVLKRSFTAAGANRQFINGSPATLQALARVGEWLVDIHGPHEHQSLLHAPRQLDILDAFGRLQEPRAQFAERVRRRAGFEAQKAALVVDDQTYARQLDLLRFQVREIREAKLRVDEVEALEQDHRRVTNSARLVELSRGALALLGDEEDALPTRLGALGRLLQDLQRLDPAAAGLAEAHGRAAEAIQELHAQLSRYADHLDLDPAVLEDLEVRLDLIHSLQRKYGGSVPAVIAFGEEAARQLDSLEQRDTELARLNGEMAALDAELLRLGRDLTAKRRKLLPQLGKAVAKQLADLGFKQSQFDVALTTQVPEAGARAPLNPAGFDTIEFQFAPNPGEPPRPLRAIASSGELARVMLALKTVLAAEDEIPVLIFDEVDANVGGETARAVGEKMRQIARQRQVLCITHLAPVAAQGDVHFVVAKETHGGRTTSEIHRLEAKERVTELARMLGGQTEAARRHAAALLKEGAA